MSQLSVVGAEDLARRAHDRQHDKVGMPYFETHVQDVHRRVAEAGGDEDQQVAALLHDVLEDTDVTAADLQAAGISSRALDMVRLLTKRDGEDVTLYLERLRDHEHARQIKLADMASNTDPVRLARLDPELQRRLLTKYTEYLDALGADPAQLQQALAAVPADEDEQARQERLDRVLDDRMAARLDQMVDEESFTVDEPRTGRRG